MENKRLLYPKLSHIKHNSYYLGIIQNLYCSSESEIICFLQFEYQKNLLLPFGNDYARVFGQIAEEDLFHSELLSEIIISLGGNPVYCSCQGKWLGGRQIDYVKNIKQMLALDIELKEKMIIDYKNATSKIDDLKIKKLLGCIVSEETSSCQKLKSLYENA